jgi:hypothetical protein
MQLGVELFGKSTGVLRRLARIPAEVGRRQNTQPDHVVSPDLNVDLENASRTLAKTMTERTREKELHTEQSVKAISMPGTAINIVPKAINSRNFLDEFAWRLEHECSILRTHNAILRETIGYLLLNF